MTTADKACTGTPSILRDASRSLNTPTASAAGPSTVQNIAESSVDHSGYDSGREKNSRSDEASDHSNESYDEKRCQGRKNGCEDAISAAEKGNSASPQPLTPHPSTAAAPYIDAFPFGLSHYGTAQPSLSRTPTQTTLPPLPTARQISTDTFGNTYPEGGTRAWLVVLGAFCALTVSLGMMNTIGVYSSYLSAHQLSDVSDSTRGWIFGLYAFLAFFAGIQIGPVFDSQGPRWLVAIGSVLILLSHLLLGLCTAYWHFLMVFSVLGGLGTSFLFTPSISAIGHFFLLKRGEATGLAAAGGSLGGVIFPLVLQSLLPRIGFAWSTRCVALIDLFLLVIANTCIRARLPRKPATLANILPDYRIFRDPVFAITTASIFFCEWGLFVPQTYLPSYAHANGASEAFSYQLLAIYNASSCFGRYLPGLLADRWGTFNIMIMTLALCAVSAFGLWLPAGGGIALMVLYALVFGFASGTSISLTPVCVSKLCKLENYGRYYATCYSLVSLGALTGIPIAGTILEAGKGKGGGGEFFGLILMTGFAWTMAMGLFAVARGLGGGWKIKTVY